MTLLSRIGSTMVNVFGAQPGGTYDLANATDVREATPADIYDMLWRYYWSNDIYDLLQRVAVELKLWTPAMQPFRNPANAVVEFYAATMLTASGEDGLEIDVADPPAPANRETPPPERKEPPIIPAINQIDTWSNWDSRRVVFSRGLANLGDQYIKIATRTDDGGTVRRVYKQLLDPRHIPTFDTDERGFLTYIRIDIPKRRRKADGTTEPYTYTEVWDKPNDRLRVWEHEQPNEEDLDQLPTPIIDQSINALGFDFVPVVHCKFRDVGGDRGAGAYLHALPMIDEANRMATRLHQMLFRYNKPYWAALANGNDPTGRPLPGPKINGRALNGGGDAATMGDDAMLSMPGTSTLQALVPPVNFAAHLQALSDHLMAMEKYDLPELAYYRVGEAGSGDLSGRAIRFMLSGAINRVLEARANAEQAIVRANQMALTIAQVNGLDGFTNLGSYETGDFEHTFKARDVIPLSRLEDAEIDYMRARTASLRLGYGYSNEQLQAEDGLDEREIATMKVARQQDDASAEERFNQAFDRGQFTDGDAE